MVLIQELKKHSYDILSWLPVYYQYYCTSMCEISPIQSEHNCVCRGINSLIQNSFLYIFHCVCSDKPCFKPIKLMSMNFKVATSLAHTNESILLLYRMKTDIYVEYGMDLNVINGPESVNWPSEVEFFLWSPYFHDFPRVLTLEIILEKAHISFNILTSILELA